MTNGVSLSNLGAESSKELEKITENVVEADQIDREGRLAVVCGQLRMEEPQGRGAWPVIVPGPHLSLRQGDKLVTGPTIVESLEGFSIALQHEPPQSKFELIVSRDRMKVTLKTRFRFGTVYKLRDEEFQQRLVLKAVPAADVPPKPIDPALVLAKLQEMGVQPETVETDLLLQACSECRDADVVIARGVAPVPPVDGRVELVCDLKPRVPSEKEGDRVDILDRGTYNAVNAGEVLAVLHPSEPGKPGKDVFGREVPPRLPRPAQFTAGPGVKLIKDGRIAVAEVTGRPTFQRGVLQVNTQLVIGGNVTVASGNVDFKGDVLIMGDVEESLTVRAGGGVDVYGSAYHATIIADGGVTIAGKLIGGSVIAGINQPGLAKAVKLLSWLDRDLDQLLSAFYQLREHLAGSGNSFGWRGDGYLIKVLLETRLPQIPKHFGQLHELLSGDLDPGAEELAKSSAALKYIAERFLGAAPLEIACSEEVARYRLQLRTLASQLEEHVDAAADVVVHYCQNAKIEATGNVTVAGLLIYDCEITAGKTLELGGQCRSGSYTGSSIYAQVVGSTGMGAPSLTVCDGGVIAARRFCSGVRLRIGSVQGTIGTDCANRLFYASDGELHSRHYQSRREAVPPA